MRSKEHSVLNIHEFNFLLIMVGFPFVTTILPFIESIPYRAFALGVALLCLVKCRFKLKYYGLPAFFFIATCILMVVHITVNTYPFLDSGYSESVKSAYLFAYGVMLIPLIAFWAGIKYIRWEKVFFYLFSALLPVVIVGLVTTQDVDITTFRADLNERQSTLAFADNSAILLILSTAFLIRTEELDFRGSRKFYKLLFTLGVAVAILGIARAGSRGGLFSAIFGLLFLVSTLSKKQFLTFLLLVALPIGYIAINTNIVEELAPILYKRTLLSIEEGDTSGRNYLWSEGLRLIKEHPFIGNNSVIFHDNIFTSYHNTYLDVFIELGVIIGAFFLLLIIYLIYKAIVHRKSLLAYEFILFGLFINFAARGFSGIQLIVKPDFCVIVFTACILVQQINQRKEKYEIKRVDVDIIESGTENARG